MGFTGQLGTQQSQLGSIVLGSLPSGGIGVANFLSHVLDARSVRVLFDRPMDRSALVPGAYTITPVGGAYYVPIVSSVDFYDAAQRSVVLSLAESLTYGGSYTLGVLGVTAVDGAVPTGSTYNFAATVQDAPLAIGAYMSGRGQLDVVFDRPVGQYSTAATGTIKDAGSPASGALALVPWTAGVPANNVRFSLGSVPAASGYVVTYASVQDVSSNSGSGTVDLGLLLRSPAPYGAASIEQLQIVDAWVDRVSNDALGLAYVRVCFNCPVDAAHAVNLSNWTASQQGAHLLTDAVDPVLLPDPVTDLDLVAYANALKAALNSHETRYGVHAVPAALDPGSASVRLANDLRSKLNAHVASLSEHLQQDLADAVSAPVATDVASLVTLSNAIKAAYNAHRTAVGVHGTNDTVYAVIGADATGLQSAARLLDEIRAKYSMHDSASTVHTNPGQFQPAQPPVLPQVVYEDVADVPSAAGLLDEAQIKYLAHAQDARVHLYADGSNQSALSALAGAPASSPLYLAQAIAFAVALKGELNGHMQQYYAATVQAVANYASSSLAFDVASPRTWFCDVAVRATSLVPGFLITAALLSEDGGSSTNTGDYTGSALARGLASPPSVLSSSFGPDGSLSVRVDRDVAVSDQSAFSVSGPDGPVPVLGAYAAATPEAMLTLLRDLMDAYTNHLTAAGHVVTDTTDVLYPGDYPLPSVSAIATSANRLKAVFNAHASSATYHNFASPAPVTLPDATDARSAASLIRAMRELFVAHNANLGLHTHSGPVEVAAKAFDLLVVEVDGAADGAAYSASGAATCTVADLAGPDLVQPLSFTATFAGRSQIPYLASAIPQVALVPTATPSDPTSSPASRFGSDAVICFMSRPMREADVGASSVRVTGGILIKRAEWAGSRVLAVHVANMGTTAYQIDVSGLTDRQGNPMPAFTLPVP